MNPWTWVALLLAAGLAGALAMVWRERKRCRALQLQLTQLQDVFNNIDCGIVLYDRDDRLVLANRDFLTLYAPIADRFLPGQPFAALLRLAVEAGLVPEAKGQEAEWLRERQRQHSAARAPILRRMADGRWRRIIEQRLSDGCRLAFSIDVTDQVEQAQSLDEARASAERAGQRLEDAIEALPAGFECWDADDRLVLTNRVMRDLYPRIAERLLPGMKFEELVRANAEAGGLQVPTGDVDSWVAERLAMRRAEGPGLTTHATTDGRWIRVHELRTRDGGVVGVRFDVTEVYQRQAEADAARAAAERAGQRLSDAIEALPDGFALYDAEDRLTVCNQRYREIYRDSAPAMVIGTRFEAILRYGVARGQYPAAEGREEGWIAERLRLHRNPGPPLLQELPANRWLRIEERKTRDGGIAGVRADVTELVRRGQELERLNAQLDATNAKLAELSDTDSLTGIANRRRFDQRLAEEWSRCARDGLPLTLLMIDVDHFKRYNDRHGHPAGDACLRQLAARLRSAARRGDDLLARIGGEEFALLLPRVDRATALELAKRCLALIDEAAIEHGDSPAAPHVTLSIGIAVADCLPGSARGSDAAPLMKAADSALYGAKRAGRHRAVLAEDFE